jgi:hypothetical protein
MSKLNDVIFTFYQLYLRLIKFIVTKMMRKAESRKCYLFFHNPLKNNDINMLKRIGKNSLTYYI